MIGIVTTVAIMHGCEQAMPAGIQSGQFGKQDTA